MYLKMFNGVDLVLTEGNIPTVFARNIVWGWFNEEADNMVLTNNGKPSSQSNRNPISKEQVT